MYQLLIEKRVQKQLERIPEPDYSKVKKSILDLKNNPRPVGCKKLRGRNGLRIRQGDYRIIYEISERVLIVCILAVGHRKEIYK